MLEMYDEFSEGMNGEVTTMMVTEKFWLVKDLASSTIGIRCPIPTLGKRIIFSWRSSGIFVLLG